MIRVKDEKSIQKSPETLEVGVRKRARRHAIENAIITSLALAGVATVAMVAPKVLQLLAYVDPDWIVPRDPKQRIRETMYRLKKKGLVIFESGKPPRLTDKGKKKASEIELGLLRIKKPARWDGRWRIVIFDIREERKGLRQQVRRLLQQLEFARLQDSVWVHPYDCEEIVSLIKTGNKLGREVLYLIADAIEFDQPLREHFDLPKDR